MSPEPSSPAVNDLCRWLDASTSPYHAVRAGADLLMRAGAAPEDPDFGFRDVGGMLLAWRRGRDSNLPARLIGAHTDSPNLRLKPHAVANAAGCHLVRTEPYGGALLSSWFDRELGISGRVVLRDSTEPVLVRDDEATALLPRLAIHLDREVNERGHVVDRQRHLDALWAVDSAGPDIVQWLSETLEADPDELLAWDLMYHDATPARRSGPDGSLLSSGRLDNQVSCWLAVDAMSHAADSAPERTLVIALFDHEEVGSESPTGALGPELGRLVAELDVEPRQALLLSADMAHGLHPHHPERYDLARPVLLGRGPALKVNTNQRYATDSITAGAILRCAGRAGIELQTYTHRADMACGTTIGPIAAARLGIPTVDLGLPMLGMHSARESMAAADVITGQRLFRTFFSE